jgi:hypothetical protein
MLEKPVPSPREALTAATEAVDIVRSTLKIMQTKSAMFHGVVTEVRFATPLSHLFGEETFTMTQNF